MLALLMGLKMLTSEPSLALEDVAAEFRKARSIQLRILYYSHKYSDEKRSHVWREVAFGEKWSTSSGFSREVTYDEEGIPWKIETKDRAKGVTLDLWLNQKKAQANGGCPGEGMGSAPVGSGGRWRFPCWSPGFSTAGSVSNWEPAKSTGGPSSACASITASVQATSGSIAGRGRSSAFWNQRQPSTTSTKTLSPETLRRRTGSTMGRKS